MDANSNEDATTDANENVNNEEDISKREEKDPLEESLADGRRIIFLFLANKYDKVAAICEEKRSYHMIYAMGYGAIHVVQSVMSADREQLSQSIKLMRDANEFANKSRKRLNFEYISTYFVNSYDSYTDEEAIAELIYASTLITSGLLSFVADRSILGIVNAAIKIKLAHSSFKECFNILTHKTNWRSQIIKNHFESGTRLGIGGFDLIISIFPNKLSKLLQFVGFHSDKSVALNNLLQAVKLTDGMTYALVCVALVAYNGFAEYFYGYGEGNIEFFEENIKIWEEKMKDSAIARMGKALHYQMTGKADEAINLYKMSSFGNGKWKQFQLLSHFAQSWCNVVKCDWKQAMEHMKVMAFECKWSPATFLYIYSTFLFTNMESDEYNNNIISDRERTAIVDEISRNFKRIPEMKQTVGGKKVFHEKMVIERSERFRDKPEDMILPAYELAYIWNIFSMVYGNIGNLNKHFNIINMKYVQHKHDKDDPNTCLDKYAYLTFLIGVCYRHMQKYEDAIQCFEEVLRCKKRISSYEKHLLPQSCFEIGMIKRSKRDFNECKRWMKRARDDYSNYLTESLINHRVHQLLEQIKNE